MTHNRRFTAQELVSRSGRFPTSLAAVAVIGLGLAPLALAQSHSRQPSRGPTYPQPNDAAPAPASAPAPAPAGNPAAQPQPAAAQPTTPPPAPAPTVVPPPQPRDDKKNTVKVTDHMTVDLHVKDEDLTNVLELLSIQSQRNIVASKSVGGKVSATLYGVTFYEALDSILHVNGYGYMEQGNFIYVYTLDELVQIQKTLKKRAAKAIKLSYLNAKDAEEFVKPLLSKDGGEIKTSKAAAPFSVPADNPTGGEDYALGATLVVIDYEDNIKAIEALLKELDTRPAQVLVEATILQTSLTEQNAFGVDFSIIGDVKFTDFINVGGPLAAANALTRGGTGGANQGVSPSDNQGTAVTSSPGNTAGPSTFKVGVVAGDLSIFMRMLDDVTDTVILANPKILALNRQPSRVLVGRRVGYLSTTSTDTSTTQTVEFLDTGTQLYFRPFVSAEGEIRMELKPQVSEAIIRDQTDATGAAVSIPDEVTQGLTTNVLVRDGQTVVLGGLFRESTALGRRQVPFLGDIPIIGAAFRGHDDTTNRSEILFLITPTIVTDGHLKGQAERAMADAERLRAGCRQGLLWWSREKMTSALNVDAEHAARDGKYDQAMFKIARSLALNPVQPDALRLRDRITGERDHWSNRSLLSHIFDEKAAKEAAEIKPADPPVKWRKPYGSRNVPRIKAGGSTPQSIVTPTGPAGTPTNPAWNFKTAANTGPNAAPNAAPTGTPSMVEHDEPMAEQIAAHDPARARADWFAPGGLAEQGTKVLLQVARQQIENYRQTHNGQLPNLGSGEFGGWGDLVSGGFLNFAPVNLWVAGERSDVVVIGKEPRPGFTADFGWVFNPETGELWAAGFDAEGNALTRIFNSSQSASQATVPEETGSNPNPRP